MTSYFTHKATTNRARLTTGLLLVLLGLSANAFAASIKCWKNEQGVRECGQFVPPEYSQQRIEIINERGIVIDVKEAAKTPEQLAEEARQKKLREAELRRQKEQALQDRILLNTFTTERDLRLSYDGKIEAIRGIISITHSNSETLQKNLTRVQKKAANYERAGEKPPQTLFEEMDSLKDQIQDNREFIAKKEEAIRKLEARYQADLARFRKLKGIKAPAGPPPANNGDSSSTSGSQQTAQH
jgi:hypothetical protein